MNSVVMSIRGLPSSELWVPTLPVVPVSSSRNQMVPGGSGGSGGSGDSEIVGFDWSYQSWIWKWYFVKTLKAIKMACQLSNPCDIAGFHKLCISIFHLNGVVLPFWSDWDDACPSVFLTPNALHQWHKFYFDHCVCWAINIIGGAELDCCLSVIQPQTGK